MHAFDTPARAGQRDNSFSAHTIFAVCIRCVLAMSQPLPLQLLPRMGAPCVMPMLLHTPSICPVHFVCCSHAITQRLENAGDIVPTLPFGTAWRHVGSAIAISDCAALTGEATAQPARDVAAAAAAAAAGDDEARAVEVLLRYSTERPDEQQQELHEGQGAQGSRRQQLARGASKTGLTSTSGVAAELGFPFPFPFLVKDHMIQVCMRHVVRWA